MPTITLKRPIQDGDKSWAEIEFDPSLGAVEDFEAAVRGGANELTAMIDLIAADGDVPREVARQIRSSDLVGIQAQLEAAGPLGSSTASSAPAGDPGEDPQPIRHTS